MADNLPSGDERKMRAGADKLAEIYEYCKRDVDTSRQVYRRLTFAKNT